MENQEQQDDLYALLIKRHRDYHESVDRMVESGKDYFGRDIDITKSDRAGFVYRLYSEEGTLLYVGKTRTPLQRILTGAGNHRRNKAWFSEVTRIELFRFHRESHALAAEAYDINHLNPKYNISQPTPPKYRPKETHRMEYGADDEIGLSNAFHLMTPTKEETDKLE